VEAVEHETTTELLVVLAVVVVTLAGQVELVQLVRVLLEVTDLE
jgi:hypothetical protein